MANELKATVVNMKNLSQDISDPIIVGGGDANGRSLRIIFTQEAAAQFTPNTKVYLSWLHQEKQIKGYNIFTEIKDEDDEDFPPTWEIHYPSSMLWEGNVLACIQLVDDISIATSTNFIIHILADPNNGSDFIASDDFSEFKQMIIRISCLERQMKDQMESQKIEFEDMQLEFQRVRASAITAEQLSREAKEIAEDANTKAAQALEKTNEFETAIGDLSSSVGELDNRVTEAENTANHALEIAEQTKDFTDDIQRAKQEAIDYTDDALTIIEF